MVFLSQHVLTSVAEGDPSGHPGGVCPGKQERSMELTFVPRIELEDREWNNEAEQWDRPKSTARPFRN